MRNERLDFRAHGHIVAGGVGLVHALLGDEEDGLLHACHQGREGGEQARGEEEVARAGEVGGEGQGAGDGDGEGGGQGVEDVEAEG